MESEKGMTTKQQLRDYVDSKGFKPESVVDDVTKYILLHKPGTYRAHLGTTHFWISYEIVSHGESKINIIYFEPYKYVVLKDVDTWF